MNDLRSKLEEELQTCLTDEALQNLQSRISDAMVAAEENILYNLKANLAYDLAYHVQREAEYVIEAILNGDVKEFERHLHCQEGYYTGRGSVTNVIHFKLFETGCLELRKRLVNAHPELLKEQRILDLEEQVRSLVDQNNALERRFTARYEESR